MSNCFFQILGFLYLVEFKIYLLLRGLADFKCIYFERNFPKQNLFSLKLIPWFIVHMALSFGLSVSWQQVYGNVCLNNIYILLFSHSNIYYFCISKACNFVSAPPSISTQSILLLSAHVPFLVERRKISLIGHRVSASKAKDPSHWITECQWPIPILLLEKQIIMNLPEVFSPGIKTNSYVSY